MSTLHFPEPRDVLPCMVNGLCICGCIYALDLEYCLRLSVLIYYIQLGSFNANKSKEAPPPANGDVETEGNDNGMALEMEEVVEK